MLARTRVVLWETEPRHSTSNIDGNQSNNGHVYFDMLWPTSDLSDKTTAMLFAATGNTAHKNLGLASFAGNSATISLIHSIQNEIIDVTNSLECTRY